MNEWKLRKLFNANEKVDTGDDKDIEIWQEALSDIFEIAPYGIADDIECFTINEDGEVTPHTISEYKEFYTEISNKLYKLFIHEEYEWHEGEEAKQIKKDICEMNCDIIEIVENGKPFLATQEHQKAYGYKYGLKIASELIPHEDEYMNEYGPNMEYAYEVVEEFENMKVLQNIIEKRYSNKVVTVLHDWNDIIQFGCVLYVYIL